MRDYQIASPSLEGVLNHSSVMYEGLERPLALLRILDGPAAKGRLSELRIASGLPLGHSLSEKEKHILEDYFHDLHSIFMKKLAYFIVESDIASDETVKLQAMLQEMIKVKRLMSGGKNN